MTARFAKYEGLGNDFIVIERPKSERDGGGDPEAQLRRDRAFARALCDRHFGIGGDGVLFVDPDAPSMYVVNSDGSVPEMCGNGLRCVALHYGMAMDHDAATPLALPVDTLAGPHDCTITFGSAPGEASVRVEMAVPSLAPADLPLVADAPWLDHPFEVAGRSIALSGVSMGNPHAVTFDEVYEDRDVRLAEAPIIQGDACFPRGVNVGFARPRGPQHFALDVLERGAGWTLACGTGACAAAVAAVETGRAQRSAPITIDLPGGPLRITVGERDEPVVMEGPARQVFTGVLSPRLLARATAEENGD